MMALLGTQWLLKASGHKFDKEQNIYIISKYLPTDYLLIINVQL